MMRNKIIFNIGDKARWVFRAAHGSKPINEIVTITSEPIDGEIRIPNLPLKQFVLISRINDNGQTVEGGFVNTNELYEI
jgi:hypothetical protein